MNNPAGMRSMKKMTGQLDDELNRFAPMVETVKVEVVNIVEVADCVETVVVVGPVMTL
jgi:hypothetical protein